MREANQRYLDPRKPTGLIPAGARTMCASPGCRTSGWAHPRGCGEHSHGLSFVHGIGASSPRVRGAQSDDYPCPEPAGLIPAGAGSTVAPDPRKYSGRAHPRGCGEHSLLSRLPRCARGSSPRVRGARQEAVDLPIVEGAHPRGCGEHDTLPKPRAAAWGSSPRVRGAPHEPISADAVPGLIPAGAGSTPRPILCPVTTRAQPRGCGEHEGGILPTDWATGSSPRVRGAQYLRRLRWRVQGLIPAGAGSTVSPRGGGVRSRAHPRGCGEHRSISTRYI